jgi:HK97 family phage portal protein
VLADRVLTLAAARRDVSRADPVTMEEFGYLLGRGRGGGETKAGVNVGPTKALSVSAWYRGCRYISETMAGLPVDAFRDSAGERTKRAKPLWVKRPDTEMPWFGLAEHWLMSLLHRGNAYGFKIRNPIGQVTGMRALHPDRVKVGQALDGTKIFEIDGREDMGFTRREILHVPGLSYNGIVGLDPLTLMAEAIGRAAAADDFASKSLGSGNHLQAYISLPQQLSPTQAEKLKAQWEKFHRGMANSHELGVLGNGATYNTVSLTPEQQQLIETRKFEVTEIARFLGVVPHKLYDLERATFSNIEHQAIEAVVDGIRPWATRIEAFVNYDATLLPGTNFLEFDLQGLLRGDSAARAAFHAAAINAGWKTPAAAARQENEPAPDEIDYYLRPLNMAVIRPGEGEVTPPVPPPAFPPAATETPDDSTEEEEA